MQFLLSLIRFARPHTIIGTSLSVICLCVIAFRQTSGVEFPTELLIWTLVSCLGANVYIVGLNQLTDIQIDRINKPYLPLASGAFTKIQGQLIIWISLLLSLAIAMHYGGYLVACVLLSLFLGTIYSLPPVRLKRFPFWAAFCIITVRGLVINLLLFLHFYHALTGRTEVIDHVWVLTALIFIYGLVIAWFKDMPDVEGDDQHGIKTFSIRWGIAEVFRWGNGIIHMSFGAIMAYALISPQLSEPIILWGSHFGFSLGLFYYSRSIDLTQISSIRRYYLFIWVLFFLEYIVFAVSA